MHPSRAIILGGILSIASLSCTSAALGQGLADRIYDTHTGSADLEKIFALRSTSDGGYILAGEVAVVANVNFTDAVLIKVDAEGALQWSRSMRREGQYQSFSDVIEVSDGGYLAVGWAGYIGNADMLAVRFTTDGDTAWTVRCGTADTEQAVAVCEQSGGGFQVYGNSGIVFQRITMVPLSANGEMGLSSGYSNGTPAVKDVAQLPDGGHYLVGYTYAGTPGMGSLVAHTGTSGTVLWARKFQTAGLDLTRVLPLANGDVLAVGMVGNPSPQSDGLLLRLSGSDGAVLWSYAYGGSANDYFTEAVELPDGELLVSGTRWVNGLAGWVVQLDADGAPLHTAVYPGAGMLNAVCRATNGACALAGNREPGAWLAHYDVDGAAGCGTVPVTDQVSNVALPVTDVSLTPDITTFTQYAALNVELTTCTVQASCTVGVPEEDPSTALRIYPDPTAGPLKLDVPTRTTPLYVEVRNTTGQLCWSTTLPVGSNTIDLGALAPGCYLLACTLHGTRYRKWVVRA